MILAGSPADPDGRFEKILDIIGNGKDIIRNGKDMIVISIADSESSSFQQRGCNAVVPFTKSKM